jgi:hypothetical protein
MIGDLFTTWYADCIFNENHFQALGGEFQNNLECKKINWDDKSIIFSSPQTQEAGLQALKIINSQNAANNLSGVFTNYNCVIKSWNHTINTPERVDVPKKTTPTPTKKMGRTETTRKDTVSENLPRKEKTHAPRKSKKVIQPEVEGHHMNANDLQSSSQTRYINETIISEIPDNLVLGNHEVSKVIEEISINYTSSGEVYDRNTTIANLCLSTIIAKKFLNDPDPKTIVECKKHSN